MIAIIFIATKIISISSLICAATYPVSTFLFTYFVDYRGAAGTEVAHSRSYVIISTLFTMLIGLCVIIKHSGNIKRLLNGTEKKITAKKSN